MKMLDKLVLTLIIVLSVGLIGCEEESKQSEDDDIVIDNNDIVLVGPNYNLMKGEEVGAGLVEESELRKTVDFQLTESSSFSIEEIYASRVVSSTEFLDWIIPVTNTSEALHCRINMLNITFMDEGGNTLATLGQTFMRGRIGTISSDNTTEYTDTCLEPGETGYFSR